MRREELLRRLAAATEPLVSVSAPGGYGKTVALSQWASDDGIPFAWLQADAADNDTLLFLQYLTAALGSVIVVDHRVEQWLELPAPPVEARILPALAGSVADADTFTLVVDDTHLIENPACWHILATLLDHLPPGSRLCVSGRTDARLPLARLRAEGRLLALGPAELALSPGEAQDLLTLHGLSVGPRMSQRLIRATEGWPVGVGLVALAGEGSSATEVLDHARGGRLAIAQYLGSEVLEQQQPAVAEFLLETSILERFSARLCRAVTGKATAAELLQTVTHSNLFVNSLDDSGEWFRYHHLAAEFLQAELRRRKDEQEVAALHCRAAAWFEQQGYLEEALRHWLAGGDAGRAGAIICTCFSHHLKCARTETLLRWAESFSDDQIHADPALLLAAASIGTLTGGTPRTRGWLAAALQTDVGDGRWPGGGSKLRSVQAALRVDFAPEGVTQMRRDALLFLELADTEVSGSRASVLNQLAVALWLSGEGEEALVVFGRAEVEVAHAITQVVAVGFSALVLADMGRWNEALQRTSTAMRLCEELEIPGGLPVLPALLAQARVLSHTRDPRLAASVEAVSNVSESGLPPMLRLITDVIVAESLFESADVTGAVRWMKDGVACLATWPDAGILRDRLRRLGERIEQRRLVEPLTPAELRVLELLPTQLSLPEIARRLFISRPTVKTHVQHIYRKLGASGRTEAVEQARAAGILPPAL